MSKTNGGSNSCGNGQCPIDFFSELLEKLVDAQIAQSEKMAQLRDNAADCQEKMAWVKSQFTNGFRSEIKQHVTDVVSNHDCVAQEKLDQLTEEITCLQKKVDVFRQSRFWLKIGFVFLVSVATVVTTVNEIYDAWRDHVVAAQIKQIEDSVKKQYELSRPKPIGVDDGRDSTTRPGK